ncbi:MAG: Asp-tRNA(Asn)/Glu-tRNA(Gln) amidotransferase GatCAB subunit C [Micavibrio sp.]|nr:Asp-tRNA(Asn)/Glu-tRNA(Gln) amidotransferase GatCAB subunit C [Micavibrio sp.]|tara:strand:- start:1588 stop:1878 length:291 start_codon:yes stop_codon:yes gene_type:complete
MSKISKEEAKRIAKLARIAVTDEEAEKIGPDLSNILGWIEQLAELNTDNVEPLANVANIDLKKRKDEVTDGDMQQDVLANAPESMEGFFVVPKVVE